MDDDVRIVKMRMNALKRELFELGTDSLLLKWSNEGRAQLKVMLHDWKLRKERCFDAEHLHPLILRHLALSHDALHVLSVVDSTSLHARIKNLDARFQDLPRIIDQQRTEEEEEELEESEAVKKKKVLERMTVTAKSLVMEIMDEVEGTTSERKTLSFWLKEHADSPRFRDEWTELNHLRSKVRQTAIELSYLLAQFVVFLMRNKEGLRFWPLIAKIESISIGRVDREVAEKFVSAIIATRESAAHMRLEEMMRASRTSPDVVDEFFENSYMRLEEMNRGGSNRWEEMMEKMVDEFFEIALHLDAIMSTLSVPVARSMVPSARVRLEDMLGHVLCAMQGLKLRVIGSKRKSEYWKLLKAKICELWKNLECFGEEEDAVVPDVDNDI